MSKHVLAPDLGSVGTARDIVAAEMGSIDAPRDGLVADVQLAVSELVTNAVSHGTEPITLSIEITDGSIVCRVGSGIRETQTMPDLVELRAPGPDGRSGRGLAIVRSLADILTSSRRDGRLEVRTEFARL